MQGSQDRAVSRPFDDDAACTWRDAAYVCVRVRVCMYVCVR